MHHLHFTSNDYEKLGNKIKCNPAIKASYNKEALWNALLDDGARCNCHRSRPAYMGRKNEPYEKAHAGLPLVQHSLLLMLHYVKEGRITIEKVVQKMSHAVATCFNIKERGFIREGYHADLVIVDMNTPTTVFPDNILYKCGWSPLEGFLFPASVTHTFVNGNLVYVGAGGSHKWNESLKGSRLKFQRD